MINTLLIRNFRLFKELKIEKLARVNLFVGKNNSGKSSLLEALRIYTAGPDASNKRISSANGPQNIQTVLPQNMDNEIIEKLWDNINITDLEDEIIRCLQLIDPNVRKIACVEGVQRPDGKKPRIPIVRYADSEERIPLKNLGGGMTRLFQVILLLVNARNGYLFIDEFENGLHWSIHPHVWKIIFILSERLNVQVFATTHNRDCIRGFHEVWAAREAQGAFHRLDLSDTKKVKPVNYTCEILADALETGVEVR